MSVAFSFERAKPVDECFPNEKYEKQNEIKTDKTNQKAPF